MASSSNSLSKSPKEDVPGVAAKPTPSPSSSNSKRVMAGFSATSSSSVAPSRGGPLFPVRLHKLLEDETRKGNTDIITWMPDGKSFKVYDKERFATLVMPIYFGSNKYRSFQRNLNLWGFITTTSSASRYLEGRPPREVGECFHPCFVKKRPALCARMRRASTKSNMDALSGGNSSSSMDNDKQKVASSSESLATSVATASTLSTVGAINSHSFKNQERKTTTENPQQCSNQLRPSPSVQNSFPCGRGGLDDLPQTVRSNADRSLNGGANTERFSDSALQMLQLLQPGVGAPPAQNASSSGYDAINQLIGRPLGPDVAALPTTNALLLRPSLAQGSSPQRGETLNEISTSSLLGIVPLTLSQGQQTSLQSLRSSDQVSAAAILLREARIIEQEARLRRQSENESSGHSEDAADIPDGSR